MSYQVIARKWRPPTFSQVIGQDPISQTLENALRENRLPHALLFTGPRGTGKTSSARILAKSLRCTKPKGVVPCDTCNDCEEINRGSSVNVIEIDGASNNGVESIRELRETVGYMPSTGKYKIYIIDEVHMLSISAFNALLKTLEEPPEHIIFIMATTEAHKIPQTILSRCQRFDFRRIPTSTIAKSLATICRKEGVQVEEEALWVIARQADGSMRDSQSLLDQVMTFSEFNITYKKVIEALNLTDRQLLIHSLEALVQRKMVLMLEVVEKIATSGLDPKVFVQDLLEEIRHLLIVKLSPELSPEQCQNRVDLPSSEIEQLKTFAEHLTAEDIHLLFDMGLKGADDIPQAMDSQLVLEMLMLRMVAAPRVENFLSPSTKTTAYQPTTQQILKKPTPQVETSHSNFKNAGSPTHLASSEKTSPQTKASDSPQTKASDSPQTETSPSEEEKWANLVAKITKVNQVMGAQLNHSYLAKMDGKNIVIGIPEKVKFLYDKMKSESFQKKLSNYMTTFWGPGFQVDIQMENSQPTAPSFPRSRTPQAMDQQNTEAKTSALCKEVENHPLVKSVQSVFNTKKFSIESQNTNTKENP